LNQFYFNNQMDLMKGQYPILPRYAVRQLALMASSQGARICILGSGIESIELAAAAALVDNANGQQQNGNHHKYATKSNETSKKNDDSNSVCLIFGGAAPLDNILPRYLSTALSKRLRTHGIDVEDRSLVRYVSSSSGTGNRSNTNGALEIHLVKSFDTLDSKRHKADLMILAPSVSGQQGTATIPTIDQSFNFIPTLTYQPWSKLGGSQNVISCYSDDGRIVVNAELNAASNIFAAGSVAKYPNHCNGHATVAGEGIVNGALAGITAATNMAREYQSRMTFHENDDDDYDDDDDDEEINENVNCCNNLTFSQDENLPILRTDVVSTVTDNGNKNASKGTKSALSSLGIHGLWIGECHSENMSTHGYWWTNQNLQNRRLSRRMSNKMKRSKDSKRSQKAVYGSGVVFYLDRSAAIRGVMIWGLPFTSGEGNDLNNELVQRIQQIIHSNGGVIKQDHIKAIEEMNLDPSLLSQAHLSEESKVLANLALSSALDGDTFDMKNSRPLHRYVPSKPVNVAGMGILKRRKVIGNGGVGDDLFDRRENEKETSEKARHPSLVHYFSYDWLSSGPTPMDIDDADNFQDESDNLTSRPPKEELLWLRKSESLRNVSLSEKVSEMIAYNLKRGQFQDGRDAVKQAPTPKFVKDAQDEFQRWTNQGNNGE